MGAEFFGDTPVINGKAYPFLNAEPRRYRLRLLNGSQARFYNVQFKNEGNPLTFHVIGSEGGLLPAPAQMSGLVIAPGERFDVIVDFTGISSGSTVMMTNDANGAVSGWRPRQCDRSHEDQYCRPLIGVDDTVPAAALKLPAVPRLAATPASSAGCRGQGEYGSATPPIRTRCRPRCCSTGTSSWTRRRTSSRPAPPKPGSGST